jgi:hypothetical protein
MIALEFKVPLEVTTAYGNSYIWYMMDYGAHADTLYTIIIKETGECWQMCHKDFRVKGSTSLTIRKQYPGLEKLNGHATLVNGRTVPQ